MKLLPQHVGCQKADPRRGGRGQVAPYARRRRLSLRRFGDCKDKATLMSTMLKEIGVDSYYVIINTERGSVSAKTPAAAGDFNHVVLAIRLPKGVDDPSLLATMEHPRLGGCCFLIPPTRLIPLDELAATCKRTTACW